MSLTTYFNHIILALLLYASIFVPGNAVERDIYCLRSIKDSMEDTYGYLASWNFTNLAEGFICKFTGVQCSDEIKVSGIEFRGMRLKGQFPRGLENCTSLVRLDLSYNELYGPLPSDIDRIIPFVTVLDLYFNNFSGKIPPGIANCSYLNVLSLDHNRFVGVIPPQLALLNRLTAFSVANNMLRGAVPTFLNLTVTRVNFANNMGLCGYPLDPCNLHRRMIFDYSFKSGFVIGFSAFSVSVTVVFVSYCTPWVRVGSGNEMISIAMMVMLILRRRRKWNNKQKREVEVHLANSVDLEICQEESKEISRLGKWAMRLSYEDINKATNGFSENNVMGYEDTGTMYKATLPNGCSIAVKRLNHSHFLEEQISELMSLGVLRHPNLFPLLGFCITSDERLLVYKFMPNGSLYDWLHLYPLKKGQVLEWPFRVKIATGLARGLAWLYKKTDFRIIHLNVWSKSILLDENFEPRLSNFIEAMIMRRQNKQFSTNSDDVDSGFWEMAFVKDDVYSFGIVLLELITGKKPGKMTSSEKGVADGGHPYEWVNNLLSRLPSSEYELIDLCLVGNGFDDEMLQFLRVGLDCVHPDPDQRPTMLQVCEHLKSLSL